MFGHIISSEAFEVDSRKRKAVKNCPIPLTPTDIRSLLGLAGHYRRLVGRFASIESPLTTLTQKSKKFEWSEKCKRNFKILKNRVTSALVLTLTEVTKGFYIYYDASRVGVGCVLIQHRKVVAYLYRQVMAH